MPATRRQTSQLLRPDVTSSRNPQQRRQQPRSRRDSSLSTEGHRAGPQQEHQQQHSGQQRRPPAAQRRRADSGAPSESAAVSTSSSSTHSSGQLVTARLSGSIVVDPALASSSDLQQSRYHLAYEKMYTFAPTPQLPAERDTNARARDMLERIRDQVFKQVLDMLAREASQNDDLYAKLEEAAPANLVQIEELRFEALQAIESFDIDVSKSPEDAQSLAEECASNLQHKCDNLHNFKTYKDMTADSFALGALVMIVEEVVSRGLEEGPQEKLYEVLVSRPLEDGEVLRALNYIPEYTEDVMQGYVHQLSRIVNQLESMPSRLKPQSRLARDLDRIIQPIRTKGQAGSRDRDRRQPEARGLKRRETGLLDDTAGETSPRGGPKRPSRR